MNRVAKVMALQSGTITLKLIKAKNCQGCPINCNQPLVDLFALRQNTFTLSANHPQYELSDPEALLQQSDLVDQKVTLMINPNDLLTSSARLYLLPLLLLLLALSGGHFISQWLGWPSDLMALFALLIGVGCWHFIIRRKMTIKPLKFRPKVTILSIVST